MKHTAPCRTQDFGRGSARALCSVPSRHSRLSCRALQGCFWSRNISPITCYRGISCCHAAGSEFGLSLVLQGFTPNLDCFRLNFGNDSSHRDAARPAHQTVPSRVSTHTYWHIYMHACLHSETKRQGEREREREQVSVWVHMSCRKSERMKGGRTHLRLESDGMSAFSMSCLHTRTAQPRTPDGGSHCSSKAAEAESGSTTFSPLSNNRAFEKKSS